MVTENWHQHLRLNVKSRLGCVIYCIFIHNKTRLFPSTDNHEITTIWVCSLLTSAYPRLKYVNTKLWQIKFVHLCGEIKCICLNGLLICINQPTIVSSHILMTHNFSKPSKTVMEKCMQIFSCKQAIYWPESEIRQVVIWHFLQHQACNHTLMNELQWDCVL